MAQHNLLVISDLHLGEDLRPSAEPDPGSRAADAGSGSSRSDHLDRALIGFLEHYTQHRRDGRPWHLVVNGDMVDFIAVCLMPGEAGQLLDLHPDDHLYGLGGSPGAATAKMGRVLERHGGVFRAFARFVGVGNELSLVLGNHDAEFHWPDVQARLREALGLLWDQDELRTPGRRSADQVARAVQFHPWFYLEPGVAWIEHGHQYDPYCSFDDILDPADEREVDVNVGAAIMRYVAVHFADDVAAHWGRGFWGYLAWWRAQGPGRGIAILAGYRDMVLRLVATWRARHPERVAARRARAHDRLRALATAARVPEDVLVRLRALRHPPVVLGLVRLLQAVMLDRLLLLLAAPSVLTLASLSVPWDWMPSALVGASLLLAPWAWLASQAREPVDPRVAMRKVARAIRRQLHVPIVVFGHSHVASAEGGVDGWTFNTGSWLPRDTERGLLRAFTHLLIERTEQGVRARLCQWRDGRSRTYDARLVEAARKA